MSPEFRPVIYRRYVDDTLLLFHKINEIEKFKNKLNLQHSNVKYTSKIQMNKLLFLLDSKIVKENSKFIHSLNCLLEAYIQWCVNKL